MTSRRSRRVGLDGISIAALLFLNSLIYGCASVPDRHPLTDLAGPIAMVDGFDAEIRFWGDEWPEWSRKKAEEFKHLERAQIKDRYPALFGKPHNYLAISGGAADGAFTAGILNGWTKAGDRPEFDIVTGVSTGSLVAPFAFLGSAYDPVLKEIYTTHSTKDLLRKKGLLMVLTGDSAVDVTPLEALIERYVDEAVMQAIAAEHRKGRQLFIGTVNLDAARPVTWNISQIAEQGSPEALQLIRRLMLASASIPGVFPPVYINVIKDGQTYDEMHVDGGTAQQVFVYPAAINMRRLLELLEVPPDSSRVYVLRNSHIIPKPVPVDPGIFSIAGRSVSSLIRTQGIGDLTQIYLIAQRDGLEYNLATIPDDFDVPSAELFDLDYMQALYEVGYEAARSGYPWSKTPPYFSTISH